MHGKLILLMRSSPSCENAKHVSRLGFDLAAPSFYLAAAPFAFHHLRFALARATGFLPASFCSCRQTRLTGPGCTAFQQVQQTAECQLAILGLRAAVGRGHPQPRRTMKKGGG
jgi:hypothetical protein